MYPMTLKRHKIRIAISVMALVTLACMCGNIGEIIPTDEVPTDEPTEEVVDDPVTVADLQEATVQIFAKVASGAGGSLQTWWTGSGTIISADGLILTNAHVASPGAPGMRGNVPDPDQLVIGMVISEDQPPIETYIAEVRAADGMLDLAVLQIVATIDGTPVNPGSLNLPFVELGDSDKVHIGDRLQVLGFPGIGGDTITFTTGAVSGFVSEDKIGDRAWLKTDTTIAGGNSGGLGANDAGQIIGVPTIASSGAKGSIVDCRPVADTNGDGVINNNDTCIPIGGFLNGLRPINLAKPLIDAVKAGRAYESPYFVAGTGQESFTFSTWAEDADANGCAVGAISGNTFGSGTSGISAVFTYSGMTPGEDFAVLWFLDGELITEATIISWDGGSSGSCYSRSLYTTDGSPLPEGTFTIVLYAGANLDQVGYAEAVVGGGGGQPPPGGGVLISGQIVDGDTGYGIPNAVFFILKPGTDLDAWLENPTEDDLLFVVEADANGNYVFPMELTRGEIYPVAVGADGYNPFLGSLTIDPDWPDQVELNPVALYK